MPYEILEEIDYENLDDLPLFEHIEWKHLEIENLLAIPETQSQVLENLSDTLSCIFSGNWFHSLIRSDSK